MSRQPSLSDKLEGHKQGIIHRIREMDSLDEMTDSFLEGLVKDSLVEPLKIHRDRMTRDKLRGESVNGYQRQVARLFLPFGGDPVLLEYAPNPCGLTFPQGEVVGTKIQFDVIMPGDNDATQVQQELRRNCDQIESYAAQINEQVREFNRTLPGVVKAAFTAKFEELSKQHAIFDDLGIEEEPAEEFLAGGVAAQPPKKKVSRQTQIILKVERMFVERLDQTNNNTGDVNNAIQSN